MSKLHPSIKQGDEEQKDLPQWLEAVVDKLDDEFGKNFSNFCERLFVKIYNTRFKRSKTVWAMNGVLFLVSMTLVWYLFPQEFSWFFYDKIWGNVFYPVPIVLGLYICYVSVKHFIAQRKRPKIALGIICVLFGICTVIAGPMIMQSLTNYATCRTFNFVQRDEIVETDNNAVRFTPLEVAYHDMIHTITSSKFTVQLDYTSAFDAHGGFGYVVPITPKGPLNTYLAKNDGFVVYDDNPNIEEKNRIRRTQESFEVGEGMELLDDIRRTLYLADTTALYEDIYYLNLDPKNPDKFTAVASKIEYRYRFPFCMVPTWAGVTLVDPNGNTEDLSVESALQDPRFKGKLLFPVSLARYIVEVQIYDDGFAGAYYNREGKIKVPTLPGRNQMPYFTKAKDGNSYLVVAAEPAGAETSAMYRLYYINATTGERTVYQFDKNQGIFGPVGAMQRVETLPNYKWVEKTDSGIEGNFRVVESVYITKDKRLFWKFTITKKDFVGVTATVVVDPMNKTVEEFKNRREFYSWLSSDLKNQQVDNEFLESSENSLQNELNEIKVLLQQALDRINRWEEQPSQ